MTMIMMLTRTGALIFCGGAFGLIGSLVLLERYKKPPLGEQGFY